MSNRMGNVVREVSMMLVMHMVNMEKLASVDTAHRKDAGTSNPSTQMMNVLGMEVHGSCN